MDMQAVKADITTLEVDAIVNAANATRLGGGGEAVRETAAEAPGVRSVSFCCFSDGDLALYRAILRL